MNPDSQHLVRHVVRLGEGWLAGVQKVSDCQLGRSAVNRDRRPKSKRSLLQGQRIQEIVRALKQVLNGPTIRQGPAPVQRGPWWLRRLT